MLYRRAAGPDSHFGSPGQNVEREPWNVNVTRQAAPHPSGVGPAVLLPSRCLLPAARAVYTSGHLLEFHRETATSRNFSARSARLTDAKARSASRVMRSGSA